VRGYNGKRSRWYQAAVALKAGRIVAAGMTLEVVFETIDHCPLNPSSQKERPGVLMTKPAGEVTASSPTLPHAVGIRARAFQS